jgi:hypothetical protein
LDYSIIIPGVGKKEVAGKKYRSINKYATD